MPGALSCNGKTGVVWRSASSRSGVCERPRSVGLRAPARGDLWPPEPELELLEFARDPLVVHEVDTFAHELQCVRGFEAFHLRGLANGLAARLRLQI